MESNNSLYRPVVPVIVGGLALGMHISHQTGLLESSALVFWSFYGLALGVGIVLCILTAIRMPKRGQNPAIVAARDIVATICLFVIAWQTLSYIWAAILGISMFWMAIAYRETRNPKHEAASDQL